jgi:hypothetical protein
MEEFIVPAKDDISVLRKVSPSLGMASEFSWQVHGMRETQLKMQRQLPGASYLSDAVFS